MNILDIPVRTIDGHDATLREHEGKAMLIVNVASRCGLTPQYAGLQTLFDTYSTRGLTVLGFPCNQFLEEEPGTEAEIKTFCESSFGVTFPMYAKIEVNGENRHPLYKQLTTMLTSKGDADIRWNFEKFFVSPAGEITRFAPQFEPTDERLIAAIEAALPARSVALDDTADATR